MHFLYLRFYQFVDADLFGVPVRIVVSPKNCDAGVVEVTTRDKSIKTEFPIDDAVSKTKELVEKLLSEYNI